MGVTEERGFIDNTLRRGTHSPEVCDLQTPWDEEAVDHDEAEDSDEEDPDEEECREYYHTAGILSNVAKVLLRKISGPGQGQERVLAMQIIHHDGTIDTLGAWNPDDYGSVSEIYDHRYNLAFHTLRVIVSEDVDYIMDIVHTYGPPGDPPTLTMVSLKAGVSWPILPGWVSTMDCPVAVDE